MLKLYDIKENMNDLNEVMDLIYEEWGKFFKSSKEDKIKKIKKNLLNGERFPEIYILKENNELIGSFMIKENDLDNCHLSPWLSCVVIKRKFRGRGYGNILLKQIEKIIEKNYKEMYLVTGLDGFYEKIGFKYIKNVEHNGEIDKLYSYKGK